MPMAMIRWYHCTPFLQKHSVLYKKSKSFRDVKHFIYFKIVHCYIVFAVQIFLLITFIFLLDRSCDTLLANPATSLVFTAVGIIVFALWGFLPLMRDIRNRFDHGGNWKKSRTYLVSSSYLQPLLLWTGATLICRGLDPVVLPSAASQAVKTRLITFVRSLSTVLAVAYILTRCRYYIL